MILTKQELIDLRDVVNTVLRDTIKGKFKTKLMKLDRKLINILKEIKTSPNKGG